MQTAGGVVATVTGCQERNEESADPGFAGDSQPTSEEAETDTAASDLPTDSKCAKKAAEKPEGIGGLGGTRGSRGYGSRSPEACA